MNWLRGREQALIQAVLPAVPGVGALEEPELSTFWARFDEAAPLQLRFGLAVAAVVLAVLWPRLNGHLARMDQLPRSAQDQLLGRADRLPLLRDLLEVARLVACFAFFRDPSVQAAVRG